MASTPRIAVVGSANTDLITFAERFPRPGETLFGQNFDLGFGGKGANQAVAARLCGAEVLMVAKVGNDLFGEATINNFNAFGVDTTHVKIVAGVPTGVAPIFVEPGGQNRIIVVKGANDEARTGGRGCGRGRSARGEHHHPAVRNTARDDLSHGALRSRPQHPLHRQSGAGRAGETSPSWRPRTISFRTRPRPSSSPGFRYRPSSRRGTCATALLGKGSAGWCITLGARGALLADATGTCTSALLRDGGRYDRCG